MNNKRPASRSSLYVLEGNPGIGKAFPYSVQQILSMFVTNLVPIGIIGAAAMPVLSQEEILVLVQNAMIVSGIATIIQATPIWKLGSGLPIFMGVSFTFVVPLSAIAAKYGYGAVIGSVLAGGLLEGLMGLTVKYWKRLMAPIVSALVVTGIGLSLLSVGARSFGGGYAEDFGSFHNLVTGTVTILACLLWMIHAKGAKRQLSILVGLAAGYVTALFFGLVDIRGAVENTVGWFALPRILPYKPTFHLDAIISICIIYCVSATETLGDTAAVTGGVLRRNLTKNEMTGVLTVDGFGSLFSGLFGCSPITSYSENVGLTIMTGVINRNVARIGGAIMIIAGLLPHIGGFISTIPQPVIGGVLLMVLGQILASGVEMISEAGFTTRNKLITAISLSIAIGFTASTEAGIWESFPPVIQAVFGQNVVAVVFVLALFLNLVLPKDMDDKKQDGTDST